MTLDKNALKAAMTAYLEAFTSPDDNVARAITAYLSALPGENKELIAQFCEINPSNYDHDDVCALNAWACEAYDALEAAESRASALAAENERMREALENIAANLRMARGYLNHDSETDGERDYETGDQHVEAALVRASAALTAPAPGGERNVSEDGWRDIASAPKDGTIIQLYRPPPPYGARARRVTAFWYSFEEGGEDAWVWPEDACNDIEDEDRSWLDLGEYLKDDKNFTHWRPLPASPRNGGE